jgi:hypothetical protein
VFGSVVAGIEVAGVYGGGGARIAGDVEEYELGVVEHRAHEHRESVRKLLGWMLCSVFAGIGRSTASLELAGGGAIWAAAIGWVLMGFGMRVSFTGVG